MSTENSQQAARQQHGWLYLTGSGDDVQQHGPFDVDSMKRALHAPVARLDVGM